MKKLIFLSIGMFTVGCSSFMIASLLPQIDKTFDQSITVTSQGITAFALAYFFSASLFSIIFSNRSAKRIIQFALTILLLGNLITLFSKSMMPFLVGRALVGIGAGIFTPLCTVIATSFISSCAKGRVLSFVWGANSAGVVFGIPFGLYLSSLFHWQLAIAYVVVLGLLALIGFSLQHVKLTLPKSPSLKDQFSFLTDRKLISIIAVTCFTSMVCLGLYTFIAPIQSGSHNSLSVTLFAWGFGGFVGSSLVGVFVDRIKKPQVIMVFILVGLILTFTILPFTKQFAYFGTIPFFLWGAFGWATTTPQQHVLFELHENHRTILSALNASAIGLGNVIGTAITASIISSGLKEIDLPFLAVIVLLAVLVCQLLITKNLNIRYRA